MRSPSRQIRAVGLLVAASAVVGAPAAATAAAGEASGAPNRPARAVLRAPPKPPKRLALGRVTNFPRSGIAIVQVAVPGPGKLVVSGKNISATRLTTRFGATYPIGVVPTGSLKRRLRKPGSASVNLDATFSRRAGKTQTASKAVKLRKSEGFPANLFCSATVVSNNPSHSSWSNGTNDTWQRHPRSRPPESLHDGCVESHSSTTVMVEVNGSRVLQQATINMANNFPAGRYLPNRQLCACERMLRPGLDQAARVRADRSVCTIKREGGRATRCYARRP